MNKILIAIIALILIGTGVYFVTKSTSTPYEADVSEEAEVMIPVEPDGGIGDGAQPLDELLAEEENKPVTVLGKSTEGRDITAYHFGSGSDEVVFVGGIHGGYSWNTALVAYELIANLESGAITVPENVKVTVIPAVNPDGLFAVTGKTGVFKATDVTAGESARVAARFNANGVDLNRNFNCEWQEEGVWQNRTVSGGDQPFSEAESKAVSSYIEQNTPTAVVAYYAAAGGVYASDCRQGVLPETLALTNLYADASGYSANEEFDFYAITGDMVNWLAAKKIPAISVLLTDYSNTEWSKNKAGITAILNNYAQ